MNGLILCTKECNLRCKYCFEESMHGGCMQSANEIKQNFSVFLDKYFDKFITELIAINNSLGRKETDVTFHGGEPILVGAELLEKGFQMVRKYPNTTIGIQTNATLITEEIIDLFKEYDIRVGVSIDGPQHMHDAYRHSIAKKGSFEKVYNNIRKMQHEKVFVGALATVTDITVKTPEEFYKFFRDNKLDFSFNPCFTDPNLPSSYNVLNVNEYIEFYKRMFDLWVNDEDSVLPITCFDRIISAMSVKSSPYMEVCTFIPDCSRTTVAINTDGEFYRCLHYCMDRKNMIGHLEHDNLNKALGDTCFSKRWSVMKTKECANCDIKEFCCGGCPYVSESLNGDIMTRPDTCASQQAIVHYIYEYLSKFIKSGCSDEK